MIAKLLFFFDTHRKFFYSGGPQLKDRASDESPEFGKPTNELNKLVDCESATCGLMDLYFFFCMEYIHCHTVKGKMFSLNTSHINQISYLFGFLIVSLRHLLRHHLLQCHANLGRIVAPRAVARQLALNTHLTK
jgi:hypothetical protein